MGDDQKLNPVTAQSKGRGVLHLVAMKKCNSVAADLEASNAERLDALSVTGQLTTTGR